ncbi:hypothetical protein IV203_010941 [Nitzschia inconspicua]|uniref:Uncharacterized protein n=1 Tax=Nitzschia inconspicua TaxID=303405 RepID=A0A9K3PLX4_9STRA|nr:hypothetical protein IV203_010941 [Nitzschia inconspicua]
MGNLIGRCSRSNDPNCKRIRRLSIPFTANDLQDPFQSKNSTIASSFVPYNVDEKIFAGVAFLVIFAMAVMMMKNGKKGRRGVSYAKVLDADCESGFIPEDSIDSSTLLGHEGHH